MTTDLRGQLQTVYDQHGELTPQLVLDVARDPEHPLHSRFEWDDAVAAEAYRRDQAHELIQSVKVVYRKANESGSERAIRAFHAVRREKGYVYEPVEKVVDSPMTQKILLQDMEREWKSLFKRFQEFEEFLALVRRDVSEAA